MYLELPRSPPHVSLELPCPLGFSMLCYIISSGGFPACRVPLHFVFAKNGLCSRRHHGACSQDLPGKSSIVLFVDSC